MSPSRQSHIGNLAIQEQLAPRLTQRLNTGLPISSPGDWREREAEQTADRVMTMGATHSPSAINDEKNVTGNSPAAGGVLSGASGRPLPSSVRDFFEPRFGGDLSRVRIHDDLAASAAANGLNARAFTQNNHIGFAHGQYDPNSSEGRRLLAHELAHVTRHSDSNTVFRETWNIDDRNREVEREVLVQLNFQNTWEDFWAGTGWTAARKNTFRTGFVNTIESTFNNSGFVIKPPPSASDVLPQQNIDQGYKPLVDIDLVPEDQWSVAEDWEVDVSSNPAGLLDPSAGYRQSSSNRSYGTLNEATNLPVAKASSGPGITQIPTVHEFGHFIGLEHPGAGLEGNWFRESRLSPGATEYGHTGTDVHGRTVHGPTDLMGGGMGLRPFYFDAWARALEEHIEDLRSARAWREMMRELFPEPDWGDFPVPTGGTRMA